MATAPIAKRATAIQATRFMCVASLELHCLPGSLDRNATPFLTALTPPCGATKPILLPVYPSDPASPSAGRLNVVDSFIL